MLKVTVLEIRGGKDRLGFDVPTEVPVHRLEVWERLHTAEPDDNRTRTRANCVAS
jgi:sRNA-binding carbon storage regulator CsrA